MASSSSTRAKIVSTSTRTSKKGKAKKSSPAKLFDDSAYKIRRVKRPDGKDDVYFPIEREFKNFIGLVSIELDNKKIGALLCRKSEDSYRIWFPFLCEGIPASVTDTDADAFWQRLDSGFKELPQGETLTFRLVSTSDDLSRQIELTQFRSNIPNNPLAAGIDTEYLDLLLQASKAKTQQLKKSGNYQRKRLEVYGSYTIDSDQDYSDFVERWVNYFLKNFIAVFRKKVSGNYALNLYAHLLKTITSSYLRGYKFWDSLLNDKSGFGGTSMTVEDIWESLWKRFNSTPTPTIPSYLVLDDNGLREIYSSDLSLISTLIESEASIPVAARSHVKCNGNYNAVMIAQNRPGQIDSPRLLLRNMWAAIRDLPDVELVTQITAGNQDLMEVNLARQTAQAVGRQQYASSKSTVSARAMVDLDDSLEAQKSLYRGAFIVNSASIAIIRRPNQAELSDACRDFISKFPRPSKWVREVDYCWVPWSQSFTGMRWDLLNVTPYDRQLKFLSSEVSAYMPVVSIGKYDKSGLELLSHEGLSPINIDIFGPEVRHVGIFGIVRCGKSVLAAQIIFDSLVRGIPVSIVDYPREDGTGTFSEFIPFLGGAYFTLSGNSINIMEVPSFDFIDDNDKKLERLKDLQDTILDFLLVLVNGDTEDKAILSSILKSFFSDYSILSRYEQANTDGFGSLAWDNTPTLVDFVGFCSIGRLGKSTGSDSILQRIERISVSIQGWIDSRVGQAISKPSTVAINSPLFAIALNQLNSEEDSTILALAINLVMKRRQLSFKRSITIYDESPILFSYAKIADQIGAMVAGGAKSGGTVIILAQEAASIAQSPAGAKVLTNLSLQFVGRLNSKGVESFRDILKFPYELLIRCATSMFDRIPGRFYSSWLLFIGNKPGVYARYYPSLLLLASVANNPDETALRNQLLAESDGDKTLAMIAMSSQLNSQSNTKE
jgi:hypothetical protein